MLLGSLASNPLKTRSDLASAMRALWAPVRPHLVREGAALSLGDFEAHYGQPHRFCEAVARPLWGLAPLAAGGFDFPDWPLFHQALAEGTDPAHPRYWGVPRDVDQRLVEMAAIAVALILARRQLWEPLPPTVRANLLAWLATINQRRLADNNWLFFRVLVNTAFAHLGAASDAKALAADLARIDQFYLGDGWYADGLDGNRDYYGPMALHFYGLLYSRLSDGGDQTHAVAFADRARRFGPDFAAWFARDGAALPFGRSLTYRFAQGSFWGACAFAGVPALPWGAMKHLFLQHLRWWFRQPMFTDGGLLSVGYVYPNLIHADRYNAPGSPYWACKAFIPLALPDTHPFWRAEEIPFATSSAVTPQPHARQILVRDDARDHVFSLNGNPAPSWDPRFKREKYAKFAYSAAFPFGVPVGGSEPFAGGGDNALLLSLDGVDWRHRDTAAETRIDPGHVYTRWLPWPDVTIHTWLIPALPGHIRIHLIDTPRALRHHEGGFALDHVRQSGAKATSGRAELNYSHAYSAILDLAGGRTAAPLVTQPNTNLRHPWVAIPTLRGELAPGRHWLASAVVALPGAGQATAGRDFLDTFTLDATTPEPRVLRAGAPFFTPTAP